MELLAHFQEDKFVVPPITSVQVVCKFLEVFTDDLQGMPSNWEIQFCIDLEPRSRPISIPPYQVEWKKLK